MRRSEGKGYSGASENKTNLRLMLQMNVETTEKPQPKTNTTKKETPKIRDTWADTR